jgi:hypothetical protein
MSDTRASKPHIVQHGECVESLSYRHGLAPDTLWHHEGNAALREADVDPHVLPVGATIQIPERLPGVVKAAVDRVYRFRRRGVPARVVFELRDEDGPRAGVACELEIAGARTPLLWLGGLEPTEPDESCDAGVGARLENLGYGRGDDEESSELAIRCFQEDVGLEVTGVADEQTCRRLIELHGS